MATARETGMDIFISEDDGVSWSEPRRVTAKNEINGHLVRLKDGLLLSHGSRIHDQFGVLARLTADEGRTWSEPVRIAHPLNSDCGYPSTVQPADGRLGTAWHSKASENHQRYHMGVAIWGATAP